MTGLNPIQAALAEAMAASGEDDAAIAVALDVFASDVAHWRGAVVNRKPKEAAAPPQPLGTSETIQPRGETALNLGTTVSGQPAVMDLEELLTTRLLIQGNSGSGKSHLLRRLLEGSATRIQQIVIDPEGDFVSLGEAFGHTVVDAHEVGLARMATIGAKARQHRASLVLNLSELDPENQMEFAAAFLNGLFDAPREHWAPALVAIDEAQLFAPSSAGEEDKATRKASLAALTNLMCRGRKRGLAGVLATQRLAKLHKNVAAEASNFLMGRTFLDIDIARAADLLGLPPRQAETIRDLDRGAFLGLGPAIARRPATVKIGSVRTAGKNACINGLTPLPVMDAAGMHELLLAEDGPTPQPKLRVVGA